MKTPPPPLTMEDIASSADLLIGAFSEALHHLAYRMRWAEQQLESEQATDHLYVARTLRGTLAQHAQAIELARELSRMEE